MKITCHSNLRTCTFLKQLLPSPALKLPSLYSFFRSSKRPCLFSHWQAGGIVLFNYFRSGQKQAS
jgi:hypothetical protein